MWSFLCSSLMRVSIEDSPLADSGAAAPIPFSDEEACASISRAANDLARFGCARSPEAANKGAARAMVPRRAAQLAVRAAGFVKRSMMYLAVSCGPQGPGFTDRISILNLSNRISNAISEHAISGPFQPSGILTLDRQIWRPEELLLRLSYRVTDRSRRAERPKH